MHRAEEDYLKLIYALSVERNKPLIKNNEIADAFGYTDQSVNDMIKRLNEQKLVKFTPYKGVSLTQKGLNEAIRLVRAHRIWEVFLAKNLKCPWHLVHDEAERLEHASSVEMIERLYLYLGKPAYCSHGHPIPDLLGNTKPLSDLPLSDVNPGEDFIVKRVIEDSSLLRYLDEHHLALNDVIHVIDKDLYNEFLKIKTKHGEFTFTLASSKKIFGTKHQAMST